MPLSPGQVLQNRYRIVRRIGGGNFGAVYRAWDLNMKAACAVKENFDTSPAAQKQFEREASILFLLRHPNLPKVYDHFLIPGQGPYLVMDYIEGEDLQTMLEQVGAPFHEAQVINWILQVCEALIYLHTRQPPVIHRDVKPANIKITSEGQAVLVDFGIAKTNVPSAGTPKGAHALTPGFAPPEQYKLGPAFGGTDESSDIYALGATMYTLLGGLTPPESIDRLQGRPLLPLRDLNVIVSPGLEQVIFKAMEIRKEDRYASMAELKAAIQGMQASAQSTRPTPSPKPKTIPSWLRWMFGFAVLGVIVTAIIFGPKVRDELWGDRVAATATEDQAAAILSTTEPPAKVASPPTKLVIVSPSPTFTAVGDTPIPSTPAVAATIDTPAPTLGIGSTMVSAPVITPSTPIANHRSSRLAFVTNRDGNDEIYTMHADGSNIINISNSSNTDERSPSWSPSGNRIAYVVNTTTQVYIVGLDLSEMKQIFTTSNLGRSQSPAWSPDETQIAFIREVNSHPALTLGDINEAGISIRGLYYRTAYWAWWMGDLIWLGYPPRICFGYRNSDAYFDNEIGCYYFDGAYFNSLTNSRRGNFQPASSTDESKIVFVSDRDKYDDIYVMNSDGSNPKQLTTILADDSQPTWSPDGKRIAFASNRDGNWEIYVMDADGSNQTRLTQNDGDDVKPAWSPDGKFIAFVSNRDGNNEIYIMNSDGSNQVNITNHPANDDDPSWAPEPGQ